MAVELLEGKELHSDGGVLIFPPKLPPEMLGNLEERALTSSHRERGLWVCEAEAGVSVWILSRQ